MARRLWMTPTARDHKDGATSLANTPVNGLLGRQVLTTRDWTFAVRAFHEAVSLDPQLVEAWLMIARI
jgi:cytochrome c-type biogenesis protein CcmH/NrfG